MRTWIIAIIALGLALGACSNGKSKIDAGPDDGGDGYDGYDGTVDNRPDPICKNGTFGYSGPTFEDVSARVGLMLGELGSEETDEACSDGYDNDEDGKTDCDDTDCTWDPTLTACPGEENTDALCSDGLDNDSDGFSDCNDWSCSKNPAVEACDGVQIERTNALCDDGIDNDEDGLTDCEDHDCFDTSSVSRCNTENTQAICSDGLDNDKDGLTDCDDKDCRYDPALDLCGPEEKDGTACSDGLDNDGDGFTDCDDWSCSRNSFVDACDGIDLEETNELCSDGIDNDGDGITDCADHDCQNQTYVDACGRENTPAACTDGVDNDSDGLIDCEDEDCSASRDLLVCDGENTDAACSDGIDNDGDRAIDCADPGCSFTPEVTVCTRTASDATGFRIIGADLDGDGYVDLVAISSGGNGRRKQRVFMNRPDPADEQRRVFVEVWDTMIDANRQAGFAGRSVNFHIAGDIDNDGDVDLYAGTYVSQLTDLSDRQEILLNDGTGHFSLVPGESSLATVDPPAETTGVFFDYDRDGILDLYIGNWYEVYPYLPSLQDELWKGKGDGTFTNVTEQAGLSQLEGTGGHYNRKPTYGLSHCDIDSDGDQDILEAAYGRQWNDLWLNNGDGTFTNIGESSHFDGDELTDYTDNQFYLCWCRGNPDECDPDTPDPQLDCSMRGWSDADMAPFRLNGNTFGAQCGDYDNDGDLDVFLVEITHGWAGSSSDRSMLLVNDGQTGADLTFTRMAPEESGILREWAGVFWNEGDLYAGWIDYDNNGMLDLLVNAGAYPDDRLYFFRQKAGNLFTEDARSLDLDLANPHALVLADYDLDGDVDVITSVGASSSTPWKKSHVFLFENQLGELNNSTRIRLVGNGPPEGANRQAIGARVTVTSGDLVQMREVKSAAGQGGQQDEMPLTFGFRHQCDDLTIQVRWPNAEGTVQTWTGVRANYEIVLTEGQAEVDYLRALDRE